MRNIMSVAAPLLLLWENDLDTVDEEGAARSL